MTSPEHKPEPTRRGPRPLLQRADQVTVAVVLGLAWLAIVASLFVRGYHRGQLIEIDQAESRPVEFRVDINQAAWTELALLPGVGESLARKIVAHREANGPFRAVDDLRGVRGIGPKTLEAIRPYLLPLPAAVDAAEK